MATLPWWVGVVVGAAFFLALYGGVPTLLSGNKHADLFTAVFQGLGVLALVSCASLGFFPSATSLVPATPSRSAPDRAPRQDWQAAPQPAPAPATSDWNIAALRALEWKRFELVLVRYYSYLGIKASTLRSRSDGGVDIVLTTPSSDTALAAIRCRAWTARSPDVDQVQALLALVAETGADSGVFLTTGTYNKDVLAFAAAHQLQLLDGFDMLGKIRALPQAQQAALWRYAYAADYSTPSCPSCSIKMQQRINKLGPFWACAAQRPCPATFALRPPVSAL